MKKETKIPTENEKIKETKKISLSLFQIQNEIEKSSIPDANKKSILKKIKDADKKILQMNNVKFSDSDKENVLQFLE